MRLPTLGNAVLEALIVFFQFLTALLGWLIGYPLTRLLRRDLRLTLIIARTGFSDNSKYFYLYTAENRERIRAYTHDWRDGHASSRLLGYLRS